MNIIWEIFLETVKILALFAGVLGMVFSLLLIYSPEIFRAVGSRLNYYVNIDKKISFLDRNIQTRSYVYNRNIISGILFVIGSLYIVIFLQYKPDVQNIIRIFFGTENYFSIMEIIFKSIVWVFKLSGCIGIIIGLILIFRPFTMSKLEKKMNTGFSTQPIIDKLDQTHQDIDKLVYKHPLLFGLPGLAASILLIVLAIGNIIE